MGLELQFFLIIAIIIVASKLSGHFGKKYLNQPVIFGEILVGLILGPTIFDFLNWSIFDNNSQKIGEIVNVLATIGVLLLMFVAGLETSIKDILKIGKTAVIVAILGVLFPLVFGFLSSILFGIETYHAIFIGVVLTATSVSISAQTLMELNSLKSKEGMTIMGAAVIDDVLGIIILSLVIAFAPISVTIKSNDTFLNVIIDKIADVETISIPENVFVVVLTVILMIIFFVAAVIFAKNIFERAFRIADKLHGSYLVSSTAIVFILLFAYSAEYIGQIAAITGAYIAGIFISATTYREQIEKAVRPFTYSFFVPIFFVSIGLTADIRAITNEEVLFVISIVVVAIVSKLIGCGFGAMLTGFSPIESTRVGVGMISRGEVGLIIVKIGQNAGIISTSEFTAMVIIVLTTTVLTPILLKLAFKRKNDKKM